MLTLCRLLFSSLLSLVRSRAALQAEILAPFARPDATDGQHESLKGPWWIVECLPHYKYDKRKGRPHWTWPPFGARRHFPADGIVVHESVVQRLEKLPVYQEEEIAAEV
jgi:hypothetical protein